MSATGFASSIGGFASRTIALLILLGACGGGVGTDATPTSPGTPSTPTPVLTTLTVALSPATIQVGQPSTATVSGLDQNGAAINVGAVVWSSSATSVASVNAIGEVMGLVAGTATITATSGSKTGSALVTVTASTPNPVASVTIAPASATITVGGSLPMIATLRDALGNVLTGRITSWNTSNSTVASGTASSNTAIIQGVSPGVATITATSEGIVGSSTVTVVAAGGGGVVVLSCAGVAGGSVYAQDGTYLGRLTNAFDSQSILNTFGSYGSQFSATSMYNTFGQYGSQFATYSAYNPFTTTPPILYVGGIAAAYVTKNTAKTPRVDPDVLRLCSFP